MSILATIQTPDDLRQLSPEVLPTVASEIRQTLLETLNHCGGHLSASLGTIELTIALHYMFNTPTDPLIWDVGHQAYAHKMLTGRKELLHTIRQKDGLAPFPRREESPYDAFTVGHSSTSIGAALGMSLAHRAQNLPHRSIAVIGDGAMTAGMAFEALNHAGDLKADLLVILNDNDMSISGNVGALSNYFARILSSKVYTTMKAGGKLALKRLPPMWELARRTETHLKGMIMPGTLFEELGFNYIGPIDGHDLPTLLKTLGNVKSLSGPQIVHTITRKGKGYAPAENDPVKYHGVKKGFYKPLTQSASPPEGVQPTQPKVPTYSQVLGDWLCETAKNERRLVAITPAMIEGSGLVDFQKQFPDRCFDVGIAEQHSVTLAAGLACQHMKPVVAIYSTFLQRAYDQLIHDVALPNLPVLFAIDRAGLVGGDGPTHCGNFDLSFLRCIPNMIIMAPSDGNECRHMLTTGLQANQPAAVRYPRGQGPEVAFDTQCKAIPLGKADTIRKGKDIAILSFGSLLPQAKIVGEKLDATVVNMRFIKPLDEALITELAQTHRVLVTLEENTILGGAGSGVNEMLLAHNLNVPIINIGIPDRFIEHATPEEMLVSCGLTPEGILKQILPKISNLTCMDPKTSLHLQALSKELNIT